MGGVDTTESLIAIGNMSEEDVSAMSFETVEDAGKFFSICASIHGFSIRKQDSRRRKNGDYVMQKWVCTRGGFNRQKGDSSLTTRYRSSGRVGCNVGMRINLDSTEIWRVSFIALEHNHELVSTSLSCFMKDRRCITEADRAAIASMLRVGFRQSDIMRLFTHVSGGNANVGFTVKDMNNHVGQSHRHGLYESDIDCAIAYLLSKKGDDAGMAIVTHVVEGKTTRLYWADNTSRLDYATFGDVISFDSTFKTNSYGMQMVPMVGVNHHHQTVVFGSGLMLAETTEDYRWLLMTHTKVMGGKHPNSVVTDAYKAIIAAVHEVWPESKHRLCIWHFNRNIARYVSCPIKRRKLHDISFSNKNPDIVESLWEVFMESSGEINQRWLQQIYACRHKWWQCYLRGTFWAKLRSTQRCERMHRYMKGYVNARHRLHEFLHNYERVVADLRHREMQMDFYTTTKVCPVVTMLTRFEEDAAATYTIQSFRKVQQQLKREALFFVVKRIDGNVDRVYKVAEYGSNSPLVEVYYTIGRKEAQCSCLHFETYGFPCGHALHIAKIEGLSTIPRNLVLRRWTKKPKGATGILVGVEPYGISIEDARQGSLMAACRAMCYIGSQSSDAYIYLRDEINRLTNASQRGGELIQQTPLPNKNGDRDRETRRKGKRTLHGDRPVNDYGTFAAACALVRIRKHFCFL